METSEILRRAKETVPVLREFGSADFDRALLAMAEQAGLPTANGLGMLLYQGAEAFRLWTGQDMPVDVVKRTAFPEL